MNLKKNEPELNGGQPQNPYAGQPQNPYGSQPQNPYGSQPQNPYGGQPQDSYNQYYDQMYSAQTTAAKSGFDLGEGLSSGVALGFDALNTILGRSFLYMFIALLLTGITSVIVASSPSMLRTLFASGRFGLIIIFGIEFAIVIACTTAMQRNNALLSAILFAAYAIINGITFSVIFLAFELSSIISVFFTTSVVFGIMAVIGMFTNRDLTKLGNILLAGLIGIILASIVNMFIGSSAADFVVTIIGVAVFMGFTAYDVNKIVKASQSYAGLSSNTIALYGAMQLYLDFINLFLKLLRLLGKKK
jgi:FtsH-binding integral membrane protein